MDFNQNIPSDFAPPIDSKPVPNRQNVQFLYFCLHVFVQQSFTELF